MKICRACGMECEVALFTESDDDEPITLEVYSDCCFDDFLEVTPERIDEVKEILQYEHEDEDLDDDDLLIERYLAHEV